MPFCVSCGSRVQASQNFCGRCGAAVTADADASFAAGYASTSQQAPTTLDYEVTSTRILLMTVATFGLYIFYWYYLTWKQYRDHTQREVFPVWHALTLFVPIYNLFRTHAHMHAFRQLMLNAGLHSTISPGMAVVLLVIIWGLNLVSINLAGGLSDQVTIDQETALGILALDGIVIAITAGLIAHVQGNLNLYWSNLHGVTLSTARVGAGEVALAVVGIIVWIDTLAMVFSPAYRSGYGV